MYNVIEFWKYQTERKVDSVWGHCFLVERGDEWVGGRDVHGNGGPGAGGGGLLRPPLPLHLPPLHTVAADKHYLQTGTSLFYLATFFIYRKKCTL